jgi:hypothetical protein
MKKLMVFEWHWQFKEGQEDVQDDPKSGQPKMQRTDANVDRVRTLMCSDRRVGVRVIAEELNMKRETVRQIVKEDLGMRKISAKIVPRVLTRDQKQRWLRISSDLLCNAEMFDRPLPVVKHGAFNMAQKQNDIACSGKHRIHLGQKKHTCLGRRSIPCLCVSSITRG